MDEIREILRHGLNETLIDSLLEPDVPSKRSGASSTAAEWCDKPKRVGDRRPKPHTVLNSALGAHRTHAKEVDKVVLTQLRKYEQQILLAVRRLQKRDIGESDVISPKLAFVSEVVNVINELRSDDITSLRTLQMHSANLEHELELRTSEVTMLQTEVGSLRGRLHDAHSAVYPKPCGAGITKAVKDVETSTDESLEEDGEMLQLREKLKVADALSLRLREDVSKLRAEHEKKTLQCTKLHQQLGLCDAEKDHTARELAQLKADLDRAQSQILMDQFDLERAKAKKHRLKQELVQLRKHRQDAHGNQLEAELIKLRGAMAAQLEHLKASVDAEAKQDLQLLREALADSQQKVTRYQHELDALRSKQERIKEGHRSELHQLRVQVNKLTTELKFKSFELETALQSQAHSSVNATTASREAEQMAQQLTAHRAEQLQNTASDKSRIIELEAELQLTSQRLGAYEQLEQNLDEIIKHSLSDQHSESNYVAHVFHGSDSTRRMAQLLQLAKEVVLLRAARGDKELDNKRI